jgi:peptide/nickel transport system permease protein
MTLPKRLWPAAIWLAFLVLLAFTGDFWANQRPIVCEVGGQRFFPVGQELSSGRWAKLGQPDLDAAVLYEKWYKVPYDWAVFPIIPFSAGVTWEEMPVSDALPPGTMHPGLTGRYRHWLGTDATGKDTAAGLIAGAQSALVGGFLAGGVAVLLGVLLGSWAGYWGDGRLYWRRGTLWMSLLGVLVAWFYGFEVRRFELLEHLNWITIVNSLGIFLLICLIFNILGRFLSRLPYFSQKIKIPVDLLMMRLAEIFQSVPVMLLVVGIASLFEDQYQGNFLLIVVVSVFSWPMVARFVRAEILHVREMDFVTAARGMGFTDWRILRTHILPNALSPITVLFSLVIGEFILLSAGLALLGYGGNAMHSASWGGLLRAFRADTSAWWLVVFPTLCIALTTLALNQIGEYFNSRKNS